MWGDRFFRSFFEFNSSWFQFKSDWYWMDFSPKFNVLALRRSKSFRFKLRVLCWWDKVLKFRVFWSARGERLFRVSWTSVILHLNTQCWRLGIPKLEKRGSVSALKFTYSGILRYTLTPNAGKIPSTFATGRFWLRNWVLAFGVTNVGGRFALQAQNFPIKGRFFEIYI